MTREKREYQQDYCPFLNKIRKYELHGFQNSKLKMKIENKTFAYLGSCKVQQESSKRQIK